MSHHNDHHSDEKKPVSFTVPLILGIVTLTAILSLVSLGNPCHCKEACSTECCAEGGNEKSTEGHGEEAPAAAEKAAPAEHGGH